MKIKQYPLKCLDSDGSLNCAGVYKIINLHNGKWYVGSTSTRLRRRFITHRRRLLKNSHSNAHLQNSFNHVELQFTLIRRSAVHFVTARERF